MTATIVQSLTPSHLTAAPDAWDLVVSLPDGQEASYVLVLDRRGDYVVSRANHAGWCEWPRVTRSGTLAQRDGGPGTYGHSDLIASPTLAAHIRRLSEPATA